MICIIDPETTERIVLSESAYRELVNKNNAWRRALENAIDAINCAHCQLLLTAVPKLKDLLGTP